jgi:RNA-directed DNA polymerase
VEKWRAVSLRSAPTVRDRVVQSALLYVMEPIFEIGFAEHSYGLPAFVWRKSGGRSPFGRLRPGRSARQAVERVEALLETGHTWVVDADIKGYSDNIPQDQLLARVREKIADGPILALLEKFLRQGVMDTASGWQPTEPKRSGDRLRRRSSPAGVSGANQNGTPQGAVISPLLANIYLNPLDHQMAGQGREPERSGDRQPTGCPEGVSAANQMIRYADDFVILCRTEAGALEALAEVRTWMNAAGLTLHPDKTRIVDAAIKGGFELPALFGEKVAGCLPSVGSLAGILSAAIAGRGRRAKSGIKTRSGGRPGAATDAVSKRSSRM